MYCAGFPNPPAPPTLVQGNANIIQIQWAKPTSNGGSSVLGYFLYMKAQTDAQYTLIYNGAENPNDVTFETSTDQNGNPLIPLTNYLFVVSARNIVGTSPNSNALSVSIPYLLSNTATKISG